MRILIFFLILFVGGHAIANESYDFYGRHYLASFYECDKDAMSDIVKVKGVFEHAAKVSGATILDASDFVFDGNGYTLVLLLSESHASIHTYPEYGACFVDFFTCGTDTDARLFEEEISKYLKPKNVKSELKERL